MEIDRRLSAFPVPAFVQKQWETDLQMNARGVAADMELVRGALVIGAIVKSRLMTEARPVSYTHLYPANIVMAMVFPLSFSWFKP